jgi:DNA-binding NarL/FixJ family response regulator
LLARMAREIPNVAYFKIETPGAAATLREMIRLGGDAIEGPWDGEEAITLCRKEEPDVVLMDISMPKMDGISATREIKALLPRTAVVILTGHEEDEHVFEGGRPVGSAHLAPPLTERELEVIKALAQGMSDRQIARSLGISEKTVRNHTSNIYRKLHIFDRTRAVIYAVREGVIDIRDLEYRPPSES